MLVIIKFVEYRFKEPTFNSPPSHKYSKISKKNNTFCSRQGSNTQQQSIKQVIQTKQLIQKTITN